jgi:steroid 5-alpha reductase family enzyme
MFIGTLIEKLADDQLFEFRKKKEGKLIDKGLWYYSRHPNYLGEVLFWWGVFLLILETIFMSFNLVYLIGCPLIMHCMFLFGSCPWMDQHMSEKKPEYKVYMKNNRNILFLWFRNKN